MYTSLCINTVVVATIITAYHQTNDEYLTGSFNERNIVTHKGVLCVSHSSYICTCSFFFQLLYTFLCSCSFAGYIVYERVRCDKSKRSDEYDFFSLSFLSSDRSCVFAVSIRKEFSFFFNSSRTSNL